MAQRQHEPQRAGALHNREHIIEVARYPRHLQRRLANGLPAAG